MIQVVKMIIDEEKVSTETRIIPIHPSINVSSDSVMTPIASSPNDTDDSFYSTLDDSDREPLINTMDSVDKNNSTTFRRALGCIENRLIETPKTDMRRKLWRNMKDERVKKGVNVGHENTPPLPFNDITASAPPKLYRRNCT